jgi:glutamate carboxypeptidase
VEGLLSVAHRLGRELTGLGLLTEIHAGPGHNGKGQPVLVAREPDGHDPCLLVIGHLDTVLTAAATRCEGNRFYGTGALDMKGGFAALVGALRLLRETGETLPSNLVVVAVPDEEIGGPISSQTVRFWGDRASSVLILEPGAATERGETLVMGRRGLTVWRLDARGTAAHSGVAYWDGRSAVAAAGEWAGRVQRLSEEGDGPVVNVGRVVGGDSEFVSDVGEEHRFIGTSERLNIVPDRCLVEGEVRYLACSERDRILAVMRQLADEIAADWGVSLDFAEVEHIPPMTACGKGRALAEHLARSAEASGWLLELETNRGGVSLPNFLADPSAIPVIDGLGPVGDGMHTRGEFVDLRSLERRIHLIAEALRYFRDGQ